MIRLWEMATEVGVDRLVKNPESCKQLHGVDGLIWEFKRLPVRILFFRHEECLILTTGFEKKSDNTPRKHIRHALQARDLFFEMLEAGKITIHPRPKQKR